jgi:protein-L-isoaspartate(D-aspartate) O-methyltransferase
MSLLELSMSHLADNCKNQQELVDALETNAPLNARLAAALRQTDRALFLPSSGPGEGAKLSAGGQYAEPYANRPQQLGFGATLSTPHHHAGAMAPLAEWIDAARRSGTARTKVRALDLGCGTGYLTVLMANLLHGASDALSLKYIEVAGIDSIPALVDSARECAALASPHSVADAAGREGAAAAEGTGAAVRLEYASSAEREWQHWGAGEPCYDWIHVGFALPPHLAESLARRLAPGGRLVAPVTFDGEDVAQNLSVYDRAASGSEAEAEELKVSILTRTVCQPMIEAGDAAAQSEEADAASGAEQISAVQAELAAWRDAFQVREGRTATRDDLMADDVAKELFESFALLRRRVGKA